VLAEAFASRRTGVVIPTPTGTAAISGFGARLLHVVGAGGARHSIGRETSPTHAIGCDYSRLVVDGYLPLSDDATGVP